MTQAQRIAYFKDQLKSNPKWALRGLIRIYERQTEDERQVGATVHDNGIGFSGCDAEILSSFAQQYLRWGRLSAKQMSILYRKMPKYARQLLSISQTQAA